MSRNWRVASVALTVTAVAALVIPMSVSAQKVANPGTFSLQSTGGSLSVGGLGIDLTPQPLPQCSDGIDNDGTGGVDLADSGCAAGPNGEPASSDDSELAPGYQPKVNVSITGSVNKAGVVSIPASGVVFPPAYVGINFNGLWIVKAEVIATEAATGTLDPLTGATVLDVRARIKLSGNVGNQLASSCSIGSASSPIHMNLITGRKVNSSGSAITGMPYNPVSGTAMLVDNSFSVPGAVRLHRRHLQPELHHQRRGRHPVGSRSQHRRRRRAHHPGARPCDQPGHHLEPRSDRRPGALLGDLRCGQLDRGGGPGQLQLVLQ
ncbi:MAG: hypothetical protein V9E94_04035 [Microthrixaceae bacterium]